MSVESPDKALAPAIGAGGHALAFRIALAAAAGFTLGHLLGWDFPFLPSLIAVQLLSSSASLDLKRAFGFVVLMAIGCSVSLLISLIFAERPAALVLAIGMLIFLEFWALARGQAAAAIFLITTSFVPLMAISSLDLAYALVHDLVVGSILALLLIFLVNALIPVESASEQKNDAKAAPDGGDVFTALANTAVLMSLFIYFMGSGTPTSIIVIMVTAITILQQSTIAGRGAAFGLVMGNIAGGLAATAAYLLVTLLPSPGFLFIVVLFFGLVFAAKIGAGGAMAAIYSVGAATFLTVLGLGLSPLPQDSGTIFFSRVSTVIVASLYTIGVASVLRWSLVERSSPIPRTSRSEEQKGK
jgi:Protein of unknown function (DUF2955)